MPPIVKKLDEVTVSKTLDILEYVDVVYEADHDIFQRVVEEAYFPGGEHYLKLYLKKELRYPEEAYARREEGQVLVQFTITPQGKVTDVQIVKSVSPALDAEAERIIKNMPDWKCATQRGHPVSVRQVLPVNFTIERNYRQIVIGEDH